MSTASVWSAGRYDAVGDRIAPIASEVVAAAKRRGEFGEVVDLACGTGSAALAAASAGARVTAIDITPELIAIGTEKAERAGYSVTFLTGDAADTALPSGSFDAVVSNMGIIFVEPAKQVAEIARLLKPHGVFGFSSWVREPGNPLFRPVHEVLGQPQDSGYSPDQWGEPDTVADRLAADFDDLSIDSRCHTWHLGSLDDAMDWVTRESPMHVTMFAGITDETTRERLRTGFEREFQRCLGADGNVTYDAPYVVVTALRR